MSAREKSVVKAQAQEFDAAQILLADLTTAALAAIAKMESDTLLMNGKFMALKGLLRLIEELKTSRKKHKDDKDKIKSIDKAISLHKKSATEIMADYEKEIKGLKDGIIKNLHQEALKEVREAFDAK